MFCLRVFEILPSFIPGLTDGSLAALTPVEETVSKRLQLLQGQLTRNIQHAAGLNPKAHRSVQTAQLETVDAYSIHEQHCEE